MTKEQALAAMAKGEKVTHTHFMDDEYIFLYRGELHDEQGRQLNKSIFWEMRNDKNWLSGWSIYKAEGQGALAD